MPDAVLRETKEAKQRAELLAGTNLYPGAALDPETEERDARAGLRDALTREEQRAAPPIRGPPAGCAGVLRLPGVRAVTGLSTASIYRLMSEGSFPVPIKLGARAVGWRVEDIIQWLQSRPPARRGRMRMSPPPDRQEKASYSNSIAHDVSRQPTRQRTF
jgi:prophage regulatory protein